MAYIRPLKIILAIKTTELVLFFHRKTTKLVFLWPNISQKSFKVLRKTMQHFKNFNCIKNKKYSLISQPLIFLVAHYHKYFKF